MFSAAFSSAFEKRRGVIVDGGFSAAFSSRFAKRGGLVVAGYIGPMSAQAALVGGAVWRVSGSRLVIAGKVLIGPAGKVYAFASAATAARWAENAAGAGQREAQIIAGMDAAKRAAWVEKKRGKLATVAGRLVAAAAKQSDEAKRAALLAESDYCLAKWG